MNKQKITFILIGLLCFQVVCSQNRKHYPIDEYTRFVPFVSIYGLSLAGAQAKHDYFDRSLITATAYLSMGVMVESLKQSVDSPRPDNSDANSFPSGHAAVAFTGAEIVRREYWDDSPWYGVAAYSVAIATGALRVYNEKHYPRDVIAGAGLGILGAQIGYWLLPVNQRLFRCNREKTTQINIAPYCSGQNGGVCFSYRF
jgi:membrane-associated phospholipid phosphatase